jgi:hypothetical protein
MLREHVYYVVLNFIVQQIINILIGSQFTNRIVRVVQQDSEDFLVS